MRGSWLSGRKHRSTKPTRVKVLPGFESLAARHNNKHAGAIQLERYAGLQNQCVSSASSNLATCAKVMRVSYNGIITDFQSEDRSSILLTRSKYTAKYCMINKCAECKAELDSNDFCPICRVKR